MSITKLQYLLITSSHQNTIQSFLSTFAVFFPRNYLLMTLIEYGVKGKKRVPNHLQVEEEYKNEFHINVVTSTLVEACTYSIATLFFFQGRYLPVSFQDITLFIPLSFAFEIVLDFFHYWSHRILHQCSSLYIILHKKHHKFPHPITILTYYQDPFDLLVSNTFPLLLTLYLFRWYNMTLFQFHLILVFKEYIEISGHCGRVLFPSSCFSQFVWLPRLFGIQLHTEDHDLHHSMLHYNYGKRFSLWDKFFGTFKQYK